MLKYKVKEDICVGCGVCEANCPSEVAKVNLETCKCYIDPEYCVACGTCEAVCPVKAIEIYEE